MTESLVYLQDVSSGKLVEASLFDEVSDEHLRLWENDWVPEMRHYKATLSPADTPEDSHWSARANSKG